MTRRSFDALLLTPFLQAALAQETYTSGPDSQRQQGVPQGTVTRLTWDQSKIFPGTTREWAVYVPAQYDASKPASVMFFCDGMGWILDDRSWRAHIVMDNLIHKGEMPVTIGVFIDPGVMPARTENQQPRLNRSFEYDSVDDLYSRFLLEEIEPEIRKQYNISGDPNDRAVAGSSSGAICAFTAAWHRPDAFRRVLSFIGSYTGLRGGNQYPSLIRKTEHKPLRVYLQDGTNDQHIFAGSWYIGNQDMASALAYSGYETTFVVGTESHNSRHGSAILPDAMRWLWQGWPNQIGQVAASPVRRYVNEILDPGEAWEVAADGLRSSDNLGMDHDGAVYFSDNTADKTYKIGIDGEVSVYRDEAGGVEFGPDGTEFLRQNSRSRVLAFAPNGAERTVVTDFASSDYVTTAAGGMYLTRSSDRNVWYIDPEGQAREVASDIASPNGIALSADQSLVMVADYRSRWVWSFQVAEDGSLTNGVRFHRLNTLDADSAVGPDGLAVDTLDELYVVTKLGIQVCDRAGRVIAVINFPQGVRAGNITFGGANFDTLFITAGPRIYRRKIRRQGVLPWQPVKPPPNV